MVQLLEVMVIAGAAVVITFLILLALPQCKLKDMVIPFGAGILTAVKTLRANKEGLSARNDPYFN